jgi:hypothetical protein
MKRKAVNASLRKESKSYKGWLKYEVEIMNENGSIDSIPAYGKDLQDALSRVVHDEKVKQIETKTKKIPELVWAILWFGYVAGWTILTFEISPDPNHQAAFLLTGLASITIGTLWLIRWFRRRNISK